MVFRVETATEATGSDQLIGCILVAVAGIIFTYYTLWIVILPFVDDDHVVQNLFLPRIYAVLLPIIAGVVVLIGLGFFILSMLWKSQRKVQAAQGKKSN